MTVSVRQGKDFDCLKSTLPHGCRLKGLLLNVTVSAALKSAPDLFLTMKYRCLPKSFMFLLIGF